MFVKKHNFVKRRKDEGTALQRYSLSFKHAIDGIVYAMEVEHNMLIIMLATVVTLSLGYFLEISSIEAIIIIICIALVMASEMINTAIEATVDLVTLKENDLAKIAKDTASSATLILSFMSLIIGLIIFVPRIIELF